MYLLIKLFIWTRFRPCIDSFYLNYYTICWIVGCTIYLSECWQDAMLTFYLLQFVSTHILMIFVKQNWSNKTIKEYHNFNQSPADFVFYSCTYCSADVLLNSNFILVLIWTIGQLHWLLLVWDLIRNFNHTLPKICILITQLVYS